jgi:hypothetical protein
LRTHQLYPAQTRILALAAIGPGDHVLDIVTGLVTFRATEMTGRKRRVVGVNIFNEMADTRYRVSLSPSPERTIRLSTLFRDEKSEKPLRIRAAQ